jgi:hypothetical protein
MRVLRPDITIGRAKKFAEQQGYRWVPNPEADMPFDALAYRGTDVVIVRTRTSRNAPGDYDLREEWFREDFRILDALPFPPYMPREVWIRYPWSRLFHRFRMIRGKFWETTMIDREKPVFMLKAETPGPEPAATISRGDRPDTSRAAPDR